MTSKILKMTTKSLILIISGAMYVTPCVSLSLEEIDNMSPNKLEAAFKKEDKERKGDLKELDNFILKHQENTDELDAEYEEVSKKLKKIIEEGNELVRQGAMAESIANASLDATEDLQFDTITFISPKNLSKESKKRLKKVEKLEKEEQKKLKYLTKEFEKMDKEFEKLVEYAANEIHIELDTVTLIEKQRRNYDDEDDDDEDDEDDEDDDDN